MTDETFKVLDENWEEFEAFVRNHPDKQGQLGAPIYGHKQSSKEVNIEEVKDDIK